MIVLNGRYPSVRSPILRSDNMEVQPLPLNGVGGTACIRIGDRSNPDFWMEIYLDQDDLTLLSQLAGHP